MKLFLLPIIFLAGCASIENRVSNVSRSISSVATTGVQVGGLMGSLGINNTAVIQNSGSIAVASQMGGLVNHLTNIRAHLAALGISQ